MATAYNMVTIDLLIDGVHKYTLYHPDLPTAVAFARDYVGSDPSRTVCLYGDNTVKITVEVGS